MNNIQKPEADSALKETQIEELLSNIQPVPGNTFYLRMQNVPWKAVQTQRKIPMKTKFALSAIAMLLVLAATVAFVPPVRAQVEKLFGITTGQSQVDSSFPLPGYLSEFNGGPVAGFAEAGVGQSNKDVTIYQDGDKFLIVTRSDVSNGGTLPEGEATTINGQPAVLNTGLSGEYSPQTLTDANGNPINNQPIPNQPALNIKYTNANKLTWVAGNTMYEMLSSLSVEDMQKIAAELMPSK